MGKLIRNGIEYGGGNGTDIFEVTQAQYNALKTAGTLVRDALYVLTDAPNLNATSEDLSYDGGATSTHDVIASKADKTSFAKKTYTTTTAINIGANTIDTQTIAINDANFGIVVGFAITNNTDVMSVNAINIGNYNKIEIIIDKWCLGGVVPKIEQIVLGQRLIIDKTVLTKYTDTREIDLNSLSLPLNGVKFEIDNSDDKFNPDNPTGIYSYLQEKQEVNVFFGLKLSNGMYYINGGVFYITEWKVPQNSITATFTASHLLDFMKKDFDVSQLGTIPVTCSLADIITSAFTQCNINASEYTIDNSLASISVTIDTNIGYKCNEMVQMAANAGECIIRVDRAGKVNIEPFDIGSLTDSGYVINRFVAYKNADYDNTASLKDVVVNDGLGSYSTGNTKGETQTLENPLIQTQARANSVAQWVASVLSQNKRLTGDWRADTRLDVIDRIKVYNKYANAIPMVVTSINYTFKGLFKGTYEGRVL